MAIDLNAAIAGMQIPKQFVKTGITMAAVGAMRGYTPWYVAGNPGAATAPSPGLNGAAVSGISTSNPGLPRTNPSGQNAYLARLEATASQAGTLWLIDRMWHNSSISATSTSSQGITPATLPARDANASTNGAQVMAALEWSATGGAGTPTYTLTYTDQDNNASQSATLVSVASPPVGTFEIFQLAAGDTGVKAPTALQASATHTSGTVHLVLFRLIASLNCVASNIGAAVDVLTSGRPRIYDDSCMQLVWLPSATTALNLTGQYIETFITP